VARPVDPKRIGGPIRPGAARMLIAGVDVFALLVALLMWRQHPTITIKYVFSTDAEALLRPLIDGFNREGLEVAGKRIVVAPIPLASGEAEKQIRGGELKPVAWTPASRAWGGLLNAHTSSDWAPATRVSLVQSPQVIAMWEQLARALGWPSKSIGWSEILRLSRSPNGWDAFGHREFGSFKLGHTNPNISTSGLLAAVSEHYAITGKQAGLSMGEVGDQGVRRDVRAFERAIVHYGDTADRLLERMGLYGKAFAHAVYVQETSLVKFNRTGHPDRLIGIYPTEGTFIADYPYLVMNGPWVSSDKKRAARQLLAWLRGRITPERAAASAFRLNNVAITPIDAAHGADPSKPEGRPMEVPPGHVLEAIQVNWNQDRKPANVMIAVDTSASMSRQHKLANVQGGLPGCLDELVADDQAGLISFGDQVTLQVDLGPYQKTRDPIRVAIGTLFPDGQTALYDAILESVQRVAAQRGREARIDAVVVLTDGKNDAGKTSLGALVRYLEGLAERAPVRVWAVAYGTDADQAALRQIVDASQGQPFDAQPKDVAQVCEAIFSFF
jgi:Ca-activated chloride channel homolog